MSSIKLSVSAPGKVILNGEHAVVYGKTAIAASLGLRTKFTLSEDEDLKESGRVLIELPALNLMHFYMLNDIQALLKVSIPVKHLSQYNWTRPDLLQHEEMINLVENFISQTAGTSPLGKHQKTSLSILFYMILGILGPMKITFKPIKITIETDLTISSGSGSSASYAVVVAAAFLLYAKIKAVIHQTDQNITKEEYKPIRITNTSLTVFDEKDLDLISKWAFLAEKITHGTPSGIDNTVCTYGAMVEFKKTHEPKIQKLCELKILLVNTNVKRDTKRQVELVAQLRDRLPHLVDLILNAIEVVSFKTIEYLKNLTQIIAPDNYDLDPDVKIRSCYDQLGELTNVNHHLLQALGVSHPTLDAVCNLFQKASLYGKLTGAGGGGYAFAIVPPFASATDLEQLLMTLNSQGYTANITSLGGVGVTIDDVLIT